MGLERWIEGVGIKRVWNRAGEGKMGKAMKSAWDFLNGWKTVIGACLLLSVKVLAYLGHPGAAHQIAWITDLLDYHSDLIPDAEATAVVVTVGGVLHKLVKAAQQLRAGVPAKDLHP